MFVEHESHATCTLEVLSKEADGTTLYFDPFHGARLVERPQGQSVEDWYAAHRVVNTR